MNNEEEAKVRMRIKLVEKDIETYNKVSENIHDLVIERDFLLDLLGEK